MPDSVKRRRRHVLTYDPNNPRDDRIVETAVNTIRQANKISAVKFRFSRQATGVNENYAWKYQNRFKRRLRLEDAASIKLYLLIRTPAERGGRRQRRTAKRLG